MNFLEIATPLAERGFRVFPVVPKNKMPLPLAQGDHFDAATTDLAQLEQWNRECPNANVGLCPDENFCFLETDSEAELKTLCVDLPAEVWDAPRVSSGRPDRAYYVFRQTMRTRKAGNITLRSRITTDNLAEFKQHRVLVVGPGSIHPKTGNRYGVEWKTIPAMPDVLLNRLCELYGAPGASEAHRMDAETQRQTALLDAFLARYEVPVVGDWFNKGKQWYRPILCPWVAEHENANQGTSTCVVYTEGGGYGYDCKHRCASKGWKEFRAEVQGRFPDTKFSFVEPNPEVLIGSSQPEPSKPKDWRSHYHTREETENAPKPEFLIDGFLQRQAIVGLAGYVGHKKSLIAQNISYSLCSGDPLFGCFRVLRKPRRVLYLCPEMALIGFANRITRIGLLPYVGKTFFYATMSLKDGVVKLPELTTEEVEGAVIVLDTAIRFIEGDENSSQHMKELATHAFKLIRSGTEAVIVLAHSNKEMVKSNDLTLENAMRGSSELTAFLSSCWATRVQDTERPYESASLLKHVKPRDFEADPFEVVTNRETCRMTFVEGSRGAVVAKKTTANADGREEDALQVIRDNPSLSQAKIRLKLRTMGIERSKTWIGNKRFELLNAGVKTLITAL
jgi:hypothetical protein